jgi:WhiB family redox-sensing transcriptional regulator
MPEHASNSRTPAQLLPVTMPGPSAPALGEWHSRGLCVGEDPKVFFPSYGNPGTQARQVCAACPVRGECLDYATAADELGIWGGLDQQERRNLKRRQQRRSAAAQLKVVSAGGMA